MRQLLIISLIVIVFGVNDASALQAASIGDNIVGTYETFARIMADNPSRSSVPGWGGLNNPPATFPLEVKRNGGMQNRYLTKSELAFIKALNPVYWNRLLINHTGWCNFNPDNWATKAPYTPRCLSLGFEWNVIKLDMDNIVNGWAAVECIRNPETRMSYAETPWLVHQFTVITKSGGQIYPAGGKKYYVPLLCTQTLYVPLNRVEIFPELPRPASVTVGQGLNYRDSIAGVKIGSLLYAESITLNEYLPRADRVWARITRNDGTQGFIAILWRELTPVYYTNWKMTTTVPLP
jgi:hypothetical protein